MWARWWSAIVDPAGWFDPARWTAFTLTVYAHLFEADLDDVAARLDERLTVR